MVVGPPLVTLLGDLHRACGGSLALVSGREIDSLDRLFAPFRGVAVGLHGLELRRDPTAGIERSDIAPMPGALREAIDRIAALHHAALIEDKGAAIAIHHRLAAPAMQALRRTLQGACDTLAPRWTVLRGRQVLEVKPRDTSKANGVDRLMAAAPFTGTVPIAFGDDITDLDMFEAIRRHGGTAIAVGPRIAGAGDLQLDEPEDSLELLRSLCDALGEGADSTLIADLLRARAHA